VHQISPFQLPVENLGVLHGRLMSDFGISGRALNWLRFFLTDHTQYVGVGTARSTAVDCTSGVPQGSVLGPLLFAVYVSPVNNVIAAHSPSYHQYAHDMLYVAVRPRTNVTLKPIFECTDDVSQWFLENSLLPDPSTMLCGTPFAV